MMLATFVIGLREGLEAALIVSIIATFLKRNRLPRWPMWLGVAIAVLISIGVGIALNAVERALPQAQQEGMESVIGLVAVVFVTGMIVWMGKNARGLRSEIEESATAAADRGTGLALAGMAFLAVVKEGFETAVFLLATLQASTSTTAAATGATAGIVVSCVVGYLLYTGGVRINLGRFFKISGVFLVFVAGGLLLMAFRTAHGAGWINVGQQRTVDLSWLAPIGSVRSALITGVLGIPADPRVIEVLVWVCYMIPVLAIALWPTRWRPRADRVPTIKLALAAGTALAAVIMAIAVPAASPTLAATAPLSAVPAHDGSGAPSATSAALTLENGGAQLRIHKGGGTRVVSFSNAARTAPYLGVNAKRWTSHASESVADRPSRLSIDDLATLFGRIPVGMSSLQNPGPFDAQWHAIAVTTLVTARGGIIDARRVEHTTLTISGGGLATARTLTLDETAWSVPKRDVAKSADALAAAEATAEDRALWRVWIPIALAAAALALGLGGWRSLAGMRADSPAQTDGQSLAHPEPDAIASER